MKKQDKGSMPAVGGASLLVVFAVLCLVIFALLSLNTVLAEQRISEKYAQSVSDWYQADAKAQEIFAKLRAGQTVDGVKQEENRYQYTVGISGYQTLHITLEETEGCWKVISWQTKAHPEDGETTLPVWQGLE